MVCGDPQIKGFGIVNKAEVGVFLELWVMKIFFVQFFCAFLPP